MPNLKDSKITNHRIILVDGMNLFHRVFHSYSNLTNSKGFPTGATFGYLSALIYIVENFGTNNFIVFWESGYNWRNKEDANYKNRESTESKFTDDEKQRFQMSLSSVQKILTLMGILQITKYPHEADDLIYFITKEYSKDVIIISNDKDFLQLIDDEWRISVARPKKGGGYDEFKEKDVIVKFGVKASQMANYLALVGDTSDSVKGVVGIGPVKARKLINSGKITKSKIKTTLDKDQLTQFIHSLRLVKMKGVLDNIVLNSDDCIALIRNFNKSEVKKILDDYDFKKFTISELKDLNNRKFKLSFLKKVLFKFKGV